MNFYKHLGIFKYIIFVNTLEFANNDFYFGLIDKGEPKSCDVKVKKERRRKLLGENKVLS